MSKTQRKLKKTIIESRKLMDPINQSEKGDENTNDH